MATSQGSILVNLPKYVRFGVGVGAGMITKERRLTEFTLLSKKMVLCFTGIDQCIALKMESDTQIDPCKHPKHR